MLNNNNNNYYYYYYLESAIYPEYIYVFIMFIYVYCSHVSTFGNSLYLSPPRRVEQPKSRTYPPEARSCRVMQLNDVLVSDWKTHTPALYWLFIGHPAVHRGDTVQEVIDCVPSICGRLHALYIYHSALQFVQYNVVHAWRVLE